MEGCCQESGSVEWMVECMKSKGDCEWMRGRAVKYGNARLTEECWNE